jgi:transposase-like protein
MVASIIRTIFTQPDGEHAQEQSADVTTMLTDSDAALPAFAAFPRRHWRQIWSTNPLERANKEITHRTEVVGVFPYAAALLRLAG